MISRRNGKAKLEKMLCLLLIFLMSYSAVVFSRARAGGDQTPTVFPDPSSVQSTSIGQNFTVDIKVSDVVDLYAWQTGVTFDPNVLECTGFYQGEFLTQNGGTTAWAQSVQDMNNTLGIVYIRGCSLLGQVPGVDGGGRLAYATFRSVGVGVSDFHLTDVVLLNSSIEQIPIEELESVTVPVNGRNFAVRIADNLTGEMDPVNPPSSGVFSTAFNTQDKEVRFDAVTVQDWYCQVDVPSKLLTSYSLSNWTVRVDGAPVSYTATENETYTTIYFRCDRGNHTVEISGTDVIGQIPQLAPPLLIATITSVCLLTLVVALADHKKTRSFRVFSKFGGESSLYSSASSARCTLVPSVSAARG